MNVIERFRFGICRAFSPQRVSNKTPQTRVGIALLMLAAVALLWVPRAAEAQTFTYTGASLTPDVGNSLECPVISNITGTVTIDLFSIVGHMNAGPFSLSVLSDSILGLDTSGQVAIWQVFASSVEGSRFLLTSKFSVGSGGDAFVGNFIDHNTAQVFCSYSNTTTGTWSSGAASPKNLGNGNPNADSSAPPCAMAGNGTSPIGQAPIEADPTDVASGNQYEPETDITCAAHTGINLARFYNSQDTTSSPFGKNWHSTWHRGLAVNGNSVTVTRADGRQDVFINNGSSVYTADPDVTSVLVPLSNNVPLTGAIGGPLTGWQLTLADDTVETYLVGGQLSTVTSRAGLVTTLSYDANSNVTRVTGPFGHVMSFAYDANNHVTSMTAPDGGVYAYTYDTNNNLTSVTYPDGKVKQYVYENTAFPNALTGIVDENGVRFATFAYDTQGRAVSTQHAGGAELTTIAYNADGSSTVTDANGNQHTYGFTTQFGVIKPVSLSGAPLPSVGGSAFTYDANGFIASKTDYDGNVTTYTYDARGNETSRTEASGTALARTFTTTWHPTFHLPTQIVEPTGRTTTFTYDAHGNLLTRTVTAGTQTRTWSFTYNAQGQVLTKTDPRGDVTSFTYDARGDIATATDALGHVTSLTAYDGAGLSVTDPNGLVTTMTYDARGRRTSRTIGTERTIFAYDAAGNATGVTMPDGSFHVYGYDAAHRLTGLRDALGNGMGFSLDGNDNRVAVGVFDPTDTIVQKRAFAYDSVNHRVQEIGAQGQITAYNYDPQGNLLQVSDPLDHTIAHNYDALTAQSRPNISRSCGGGSRVSGVLPPPSGRRKRRA
jgi:YD repeat-containing protein